MGGVQAADAEGAMTWKQRTTCVTERARRGRGARGEAMSASVAGDGEGTRECDSGRARRETKRKVRRRTRCECGPDGGDQSHAETIERTEERERERERERVTSERTESARGRSIDRWSQVVGIGDGWWQVV
jgi:Flp pilus assembly protein TadD